jgi:hypothetical protein
VARDMEEGTCGERVCHFFHRQTRIGGKMNAPRPPVFLLTKLHSSFLVKCVVLFLLLVPKPIRMVIFSSKLY